jgi:hypothetical protein
MARPTIYGAPMTPAERQRRRRERLRKEAPRLTPAERQRRRREQLRKEAPRPMTGRQELHIARAEIRRLRLELATLRKRITDAEIEEAAERRRRAVLDEFISGCPPDLQERIRTAMVTMRTAQR